MPITIQGKKYYNPYMFEGSIFEEYSTKVITFGSNHPVGGISRGLHIYDFFKMIPQDLSIKGSDLSFRDCMGNIIGRSTLSNAIIFAENYKDLKTREKERHTKEWKEKANAFKLGKVCCKCGSDKLLAVHHISNKDYLNLTKKNCIVICRDCHYKIHNPLSK